MQVVGRGTRFPCGELRGGKVERALGGECQWEGNEVCVSCVLVVGAALTPGRAQVSGRGVGGGGRREG